MFRQVGGGPNRTPPSAWGNIYFIEKSGKGLKYTSMKNRIPITQGGFIIYSGLKVDSNFEN